MRLVRRLAITGFAAALGLTTACTGALRHPTAMDVVLLTPRWPGTTVEQLERGRSLYIRRCSGCHSLPLPQDYPQESWPRLVDKMAHKARLSPAEREDMVRFVVAVASDGGTASAH